MGYGLDPLNYSHVAKVNAIEGRYYASGRGDRIADSTDVLGFDCGGQQWVLEVAFPIGKLDDSDSMSKKKDLEFVEKLLKIIKEEKIPAHSPIEQRWTASSTAPMSPAFSKDPNEVFSWVGIIMYLPPTQGQDGREAITEAFHNYCKILEPLFEEYGAVPHWAKIEVPKDQMQKENYIKRLEKRYDIEKFFQMKEKYDPHNILSNDLMNTLFFDKRFRKDN